MATWQEGSGARLLGGIGQINNNAPQASDINPTLGLIRENNDLARSGANNVALTGLRGVADIAGMYQQEQQQKAQNAFNQAHANAWQSGDVSSLRDFAAANPAFVAQAQQAVVGLDEQQKRDMTNQAAGLRLALSQGPEAYGHYLQKNAGDLSRVGANPNVLAQMGMQNPQGAAQLFDTLGLAAQGDKYFDIVGNNAKLQQAGQIAQANLNLGQQRLQQQALYQQGQLDQGQQQLNLTAQKNQADNANKRLELSLKAGENSAKSLATQQASVQKMQDYVGSHQSSVNNVAGMYDTLNQVKSIPPNVFDGVFGFGGAVNSRIPGTDSADAWAKIEQMQGQARLMGVIGMKGTGPVSDSEGQAAARAFLAVNQNMSPKAARSALDNWQRVLERQTSYLQKQQPVVETYQRKIDTFNNSQNATGTGPRAGISEGGYTFLGGDPSNQNNWRKD
ncbi:phage DNA ejection protein [Serratia entomophila]|uniref:phage DNA ejection protein n=1 Tax=Serratia entomophila TaxID=42906 RepID=UPI001F22381B|nr:phage DNA ejection protein [Serratia entomophila]UIW19498.1 DNA transfer protein [Serratia entomophila]CAI0690856.1 Uncharacterised protein [Serratia entomophila]CAI0801618.1 Uncharacterised protein [Serratia entomophila]CAI0872947.1 Uncharacterised protein [Serratia entomophila]CAI0882780.1 Uncharacterised protein [Serratia entomophila]